MTTTLSNLINGNRDAGVTGTGKRAAYACITCNTSTAWWGYALYDENFKPLTALGTPATAATNAYGAPLVVQYTTGTFANQNMFLQNASASQTAPSSSGTSNFVNSTNASGEFGNSMVDIFSDGTHGQSSRTNGSWDNKHWLNRAAINSDHSNRRVVYILKDGVIKAVDRLFGSYTYGMVQNAADFTVTGLNTSMIGSASYNASRKELTILSYKTSGGSFDVITFQNVDFDTYNSPAVALARPEVVRVNSTVQIPNWNVDSSESYYAIRPVVADDGRVWVVTFFENSNTSLSRFTRNGTTGVTATFVVSQSNTTSYGYDSGQQYYGIRQITSRDGSSTIVFNTYYYYGSGVTAFIIDRRSSTYTSYQYGDSSQGHQVLPYKDSGWLFVYAGNFYASNYSGAYIAATYERNTVSGGHTQIGSTQYFPYAPGPNTTNYPGWTQVSDYNLLVPNNYGVK